MNTFYAVLQSPKFWTALVAVAQTILFQFVPAFPVAVWASIDALAATIISCMVINDVRNIKADVQKLKQP